MKIFLRKANRSDDIGMWLVRTAAINDIGEKYYPRSEIAKWASVEMPKKFGEIVERDDWYVAVQGDEIVATGLLDVSGKSLGAIFVRPDQQRKGLATMMLSKLEDVARDKGIDRLTLESTLNAFEFYEKNGFSIVKRSKYRLQNGYELDCIVMEKRI